ncbi:hypothetical protein [Piscibacillus salipiscarius]|nr:hypothetical protein [Piscibacillus salipiscarius]
MSNNLEAQSNPLSEEESLRLLEECMKEYGHEINVLFILMSKINQMQTT